MRTRGPDSLNEDCFARGFREAAFLRGKASSQLVLRCNPGLQKFIHTRGPFPRLTQTSGNAFIL